MVAKINNGSSLFGALTYNIDKVKKGEARVIHSNRIIQNITGNPDLDLTLAMRSFENYLYLNDRIKKGVVHISLNPDPKDSLTDEQYRALAEDYLEKMGFKDQPYLIYKHEDIDRHHIHIVTVRVNEQGQKIPDTYEHYKSMQACRELECKYQLHPAIGNKEDFGEHYIKKINYRQGDIKRQISNTLRSLNDLYRFHSFGEYNALLSCYNIHAKLVQGERYGQKYNGIVYAATDNNGNIVSTPFKSSLFGKRFGFAVLDKTMKKHIEKLKQSDYPEIIQPAISRIAISATSKEDFTEKLREAGIDVVFRENEDRIYGVTFIDHRNKIVVNGSRLGKELSANKINALFNRIQDKEVEIQPKEITIKKETIRHTPSMLEQAFGIFDLQTHEDDPEERKLDYDMRKRKKKKRKKGRSL